VQLEWHQGGLDLELTIDGHGSIEYYAEGATMSRETLYLFVRRILSS
jgi:hypothetical protein